MDRIKIINLECFAKHGVYEEENMLGQKFIVSAALFLDTRKAGVSDDINESVNYAGVCRSIVDWMQDNTCNLIEAVAEKLAEMILMQFEPVKKVTVEVKKPWAPIGMPLETVAVEITRKKHTAYVAFGSNLGDSRQLIDEAVEKLGSIAQNKVLKVSDYIVTKPYGVEDQPDFLNGCLMLETLLEPLELLDAMQNIENEAGRKRIKRWGPRTLDLDLIFYDDDIICNERLTVPHADMKNREFVLKPMAQIAPYYVHPVYKKTMLEMLKEL